MVGWLDVFTRNEYKDLFLESLQFYQKNKGLEIHAWCILTNHVHLVFRSINDQKPELLIGDLKRFTSQSIVKSIKENSRDPSGARLQRVPIYLIIKSRSVCNAAN